MAIQHWLLAAQLGRTDDVTEEFFEKGMWTTGYLEKFFKKISLIQEEDRVALKSHFSTKAEGDERRKWTIRIKRLGTVTKNFNNGHVIFIKWDPPMKPVDYVENYGQTIHLLKDEDLIKKIFNS